MGYFLDEIDILSNKVIDHIHKKEFDEAEAGCKQLLKEFPDMVDGLYRYTELYDAKGDKENAIKYYQKTIDFMRPYEGFDRRTIKMLEKRIAQLTDELNSK